MIKFHRIALGTVMLTLALGLAACTTPKQNPSNALNLSAQAYTTGGGAFMHDKVKYPNVNFSFNSAVVDPSWYHELDEVALALKSHPNAMAKLYGFTDDTGSHSYNMMLSKRRANAVAKYLISKGACPKQIMTRGFGMTHPIAHNGYTVGEHLNRRVEVTVVPMK